MKFYSEVTKEMYDTIEALQKAEEKASIDVEKEQAIDEIMELVKQTAKIERDALAKMRVFDRKYGFGAASKELLKRAQKEEGVTLVWDDEPLTMKVKAPKIPDSFVDSLRSFLDK